MSGWNCTFDDKSMHDSIMNAGGTLLVKSIAGYVLSTLRSKECAAGVQTLNEVRKKRHIKQVFSHSACAPKMLFSCGCGSAAVAHFCFARFVFGVRYTAEYLYCLITPNCDDVCSSIALNSVIWGAKLPGI